MCARVNAPLSQHPFRSIIDPLSHLYSSREGRSFIAQMAIEVAGQYRAAAVRVADEQRSVLITLAAFHVHRLAIMVPSGYSRSGRRAGDALELFHAEGHSVIKVNSDGSFGVVTEGLNEPTSLEFIGDTADVVTLGGEVWVIDDVSRRRR